MNGSHVRKLVVAAMFVALAVTLSTLSFPVGASRCFPVQHMVNVLSAVLLGPGYGVAVAFCTSLIRNLLGTGTLLAFPGSMIGALCCGLMYKYTKRLLPTYIAEVVGTGVLGGLAAYPVAAYRLTSWAEKARYMRTFFRFLSVRSAEHCLRRSSSACSINAEPCGLCRRRSETEYPKPRRGERRRSFREEISEAYDSFRTRSSQIPKAIRENL